MKTPSFSILGSCVTRDALEFINNNECVFYLARSSICSIFSKQPSTEEVQLLNISNDAHNFHKGCIEHDVFKTGIEQLGAFNNPIIIDLIEERVPLGVLPSGAIVTSSQTSRMYSNLDNLLESKIKEFSNEHLILFESSMQDCSEFFSDKKVFIHKALYVDDMQKSNENAVLNTMYGMLLKAIPHAILIEPEPKIANNNHKWGLAPYHYIDLYYKSFVNLLSEHDNSVHINSSMSMNK